MNTLLTIVLFVIGVIVTWYYAKKQMAKNEISHFLLTSYDIGMGLKNDFPEFSILYNDEEMAKYVRVYEGCFLNTGNKDINNSNEDLEIDIIFPKYSTVKAVKVGPLTEDLKVDAILGINANEVKFIITKLLKTSERFNYAAIIESTKPINGSHEALHFKHRIPDTDSIKDGDKQYENKKRRNHRAFEIILCILCVLFIVSEVLSYIGPYPLLRMCVSSHIPYALLFFVLFLYLWYDKYTDKKYMLISYNLKK